ncbi:hypothetical protein LMG29542_01420 [Paraburkholderia humisilvae]|uniref:Uncharacterized protein n=1 Tax=Paraburkholderia humisilvae TaxID=627669 RepID=A0A6J5DA22_9BURK|nr:hypothetical protein LMG29542_01420 [Paraburkholderia humisilvae]
MGGRLGRAGTLPALTHAIEACNRNMHAIEATHCHVTQAANKVQRSHARSIRMRRNRTARPTVFLNAKWLRMTSSDCLHCFA